MLMIMHVWLQYSLFDSFQLKNTKRGEFDSYLKQEIRKWGFEKKWVLVTRVEKDEEEDAMVSIIVFNAQLTLSHSMMK